MTKKTKKSHTIKPHYFEVIFYEDGKRLIELDKRFWFNFEKGEQDGYALITLQKMTLSMKL